LVFRMGEESTGKADKDQKRTGWDSWERKKTGRRKERMKKESKKTKGYAWAEP